MAVITCAATTHCHVLQAKYMAFLPGSDIDEPLPYNETILEEYEEIMKKGDALIDDLNKLQLPLSGAQPPQWLRKWQAELVAAITPSFGWDSSKRRCVRGESRGSQMRDEPLLNLVR